MQDTLWQKYLFGSKNQNVNKQLKSPHKNVNKQLKPP